MRKRGIAFLTAAIMTFALAGSVAAWTPKVGPVIDLSTSYCSWVTTATTPYTAVYVYLDPTGGKPTAWKAFGSSTWVRISGKVLNRYDNLSAGTAYNYPLSTVSVSVKNAYGQADHTFTCR